jgi:hypothetical protein
MDTRAPVGSIDSNKELQVRRPGTMYRWEFDFASPGMGMWGSME